MHIYGACAPAPTFFSAKLSVSLCICATSWIVCRQLSYHIRPYCHTVRLGFEITGIQIVKYPPKDTTQKKRHKKFDKWEPWNNCVYISIYIYIYLQKIYLYIIYMLQRQITSRKHAYIILTLLLGALRVKLCHLSSDASRLKDNGLWKPTCTAW